MKRALLALTLAALTATAVVALAGCGTFNSAIGKAAKTEIVSTNAALGTLCAISADALNASADGRPNLTAIDVGHVNLDVDTLYKCQSDTVSTTARGAKADFDAMIDLVKIGLPDQATAVLQRTQQPGNGGNLPAAWAATHASYEAALAHWKAVRAP